MGEHKRQSGGRVSPAGLVGLGEREGVGVTGSKEGSISGEGSGVVSIEDEDGERSRETRWKLQGELGWWGPRKTWPPLHEHSQRESARKCRVGNGDCWIVTPQQVGAMGCGGHRQKAETVVATAKAESERRKRASAAVEHG